jgi:hypothetical protein
MRFINVPALYRIFSVTSGTRGAAVRFPAGVRDFFLHNVQTALGPTQLLMDTVD